MRFEEHLRQQMENPEYRKEYNKLQPLMDAGTEVLRIRCERNLSLAELAKLTGISRRTLSRLGHFVGDPKLSVLNRLAQSTGRVLRVRFEEESDEAFT